MCRAYPKDNEALFSLSRNSYLTSFHCSSTFLTPDHNHTRKFRPLSTTNPQTAPIHRSSAFKGRFFETYYQAKAEASSVWGQ